MCLEIGTQDTRDHLATISTFTRCNKFSTAKPHTGLGIASYAFLETYSLAKRAILVLCKYRYRIFKEQRWQWWGGHSTRTNESNRLKSRWNLARCTKRLFFIEARLWIGAEGFFSVRTKNEFDPRRFLTRCARRSYWISADGTVSQWRACLLYLYEQTDTSWIYRQTLYICAMDSWAFLPSAQFAVVTYTWISNYLHYGYKKPWYFWKKSPVIVSVASYLYCLQHFRFCITQRWLMSCSSAATAAVFDAFIIDACIQELRVLLQGPRQIPADQLAVLIIDGVTGRQGPQYCNWQSQFRCR